MSRSRLEIHVSRVWTEDWTSLEKLHTSDLLFADLRVLVNGKLLPGTENITNGKQRINLMLTLLMRLRRFKKPPIDYADEVEELSGFKYRFEYPRDRGEVLWISVLQNGRPLAGFERVEFDLETVKTEVRRFRRALQTLMLQSIPRERAVAWWESRCVEDFVGPDPEDNV